MKISPIKGFDERFSGFSLGDGPKHKSSQVSLGNYGYELCLCVGCCVNDDHHHYHYHYLVYMVMVMMMVVCEWSDEDCMKVDEDKLDVSFVIPR
ncbi:hypothetical protein EUTSA_v10015137mg [Eutrema salsugineum]|uniref:Uncharacterized protein n=2 Tax=Eutrema salsugineum TaxID=72664 RepID=V4KQQ6_EUTSA|nr:hypothetical protein EUTSA_v10015137mg [Eutrema salsugineum]